ncbi:MAG TPA: hypothetical protein ENK02_04595 [Planctomycetes bacterium]|nr:hypothetical protein [Planctomycetota bacterium]
MKVQEAARRMRRLSWYVLGAMALLLYFFVFRRFRIPKLDHPGMRAVPSILIPGERHLIDRKPPERLQRDWVVLFQGRDGGVAFSRVRGLPGETLRIVGDKVQLLDRKGAPIPLPAELDPRSLRVYGRIPEGRYFLLNEDLGAPFADSRRLGWISRRQVQFRVLFALGKAR